jgi:DNA primase
MQIDFNAFVDWAKKRFSNILIKGNEVRINSFFAEKDNKHHLWCNPKGGKKGVNFGVYHCFKTDKKGTLVNLVMEVEKCDFSTALKILKGNIRATDKDLSSIIDYEEESVSLKNKKLEIRLPDHCEILCESNDSYYHNLAKNYLTKRKMDYNNFFVCTNGKYKGRIVIPYFDFDFKSLIYFNSRALYETNLRYLGPPKEIGVGKEEVLFLPKKIKHEKIYLTEGEFDACSLNQAGFSAVACGGKNLSDIQAAMLSSFKICLCLDLDKAGTEAIKSMKTKLNAFNLTGKSDRITLVRPAVGFKDWNEMLIKHSSNILKAYVEKNETSIDQMDFLNIL